MKPKTKAGRKDVIENKIEKDKVAGKKAEYNKVRIELGALATGMFYASQKDRIEAFNRVRQVIYRKLEKIGLTDKQEKKDDKEYEEKYTDAKLLKLIEKELPKLPKEEQGYIEQILDLLKEARQKEGKYKELMRVYIESEPIYDKWLKNVKGISTINTANLLQYFGYCEKARHCSSLWKYAGLHVVGGHAPKLSMYGKGKEVEKLDYNPKLRTLMFRIGDCFVKCRTIPYRNIYDSEKERQLKLGGWDEKKKVMKNKDIEGAPQSLLHADLRARRKMVKRFLADFYEKSLLLRGVKPDKVYAHRFDSH